MSPKPFFVISRFLIILRSSHRRCSVKKMFLEILQYSQENTCARASFLIKLHACFYRTPTVAASVFFFFLVKMFHFLISCFNILKETLISVSEDVLVSTETANERCSVKISASQKEVLTV